MTLELDPAAALIATCARCTFDDRQRRDIRAVLERGVDWERVLALAEKNFVLPLLFESLETLRELVPEAVYAWLAKQRKLVRFRGGLFVDELIRISASLEATGITVLHYKGPVSSELLYGDRFRRTYFDLDFLVRREDLHAVSNLLRNDGYRADLDLDALSQEHFEREQKEHTFTSGLLCVEPHWSLTARRYPFPIDYARTLEARRRLRSWRNEDSHVRAGGHVAGAEHGGREGKVEAVADGDGRRATVPVDGALSRGVCASAREAPRLRTNLLVGAHLAETLLEAPIPAAIRARIQANSRRSRASRRE